MTEILQKEVISNGQTGIPGAEAEPKKIDPKEKFIIIDGEGWVTARIHLSKGLYDIVGFLKEVEDNVRFFYVQRKKEENEKKALVKPGFRGFNPFGRK